MASSYTALGVELMVTGENAGTWGTKTNTNLQLFEQLTGGYLVQTLNAAGAGANTTALDVDDGALTGTACNRVVILGAESAHFEAYSLASILLLILISNSIKLFTGTLFFNRGNCR